MTAIALIGGDGAGKSTLAHLLTETLAVRTRYLYMGMNPDSSNIALPTTKLVHALKVRRTLRSAPGSLTAEEARASLHRLEHRNTDRGPVWAAARLINRLAEETLRQLISWRHQAAGEIVIYDRHFLFDNTPSPGARLTERLHLWFLEHLYPKPQLVFLLDAPGAVLWERTQEVPAEQLDAKRAAFLERAALVGDFRVVDATRPIDEIHADLTRQIMDYLTSRGRDPGMNDRPGGSG